MSEQKQSLTITQFVNMKRQEIILSYESAKEIALKSYDSILQVLDAEMKKSAELEKQIPKDAKKNDTEYQPEPVVKIDTKGKKK